MPFLPRIVLLDGGSDEAWDAGFNAQNNGWRIKIWRNIPHFAAVLAQERYEWARRWKLLYVWPLWFIGRFDDYRRDQEVMSHAIEVVAAQQWYSAPLGIKLDEEARSLQSYSYFKGWTKMRCRLAIVDCLPAARKWVNAHRKIIDADFKLGGRVGQ